MLNQASGAPKIWFHCMDELLNDQVTLKSTLDTFIVSINHIPKLLGLLDLHVKQNIIHTTKEFFISFFNLFVVPFLCDCLEDFYKYFEHGRQTRVWVNKRYWSSTLTIFILFLVIDNRGMAVFNGDSILIWTYIYLDVAQMQKVNNLILAGKGQVLPQTSDFRQMPMLSNQRNQCVYNKYIIQI